ncbi:hypothetical protein KY348_00030 [Candidatus Woesearchaeota archaeon]|nr:hypothetical protein [Candidatus Woesearchaeota archaeon]
MVVAKLWQVGGDGFISFYSKSQGRHFGIPPELEHLVSRCSQVIYAQQRKAIELFIINNPSDFSKVYLILSGIINTDTISTNLKRIDIESIIQEHGLDKESNLSETEAKAGVVYRTHHKYRDKHESIRKVVLADICNHFRAKPDKLKSGGHKSKLILEDELLRPTTINDCGHVRIWRGTKSELHPGFCELDLGADLVIGCPVYTEKITNSKGESVYLFHPENGCDYCYARPNNKSNFTSVVFHADEKIVAEQIREHKEFFKSQGLKLKALRIGQRTENFIPELMDSVLALITGAYKEGVITVFPTKMLFFDKEYAKVFKECKTRLLSSIDIDEFSPGVCRKGFTNEIRMIDMPRKYHEAGAWVARYPITDMTNPPWEQKFENVHKSYLLTQKDKIPTHFLLFRGQSRRHVRRATDTIIIPNKEFKRQKSGQGLQFSPMNAYVKIDVKNFYYPLSIHSFYKEIIQGKHPGLGVCSVAPPITESLCSNCGIPGLESKIGLQEEVPLKNKEELRRRRREAYYKKKAREKETEELDMAWEEQKQGKLVELEEGE